MMPPSRCRTTRLSQPWLEHAPRTDTSELFAAAFGLLYVTFPSPHQDFHSLEFWVPAAMHLPAKMHLEGSRLLSGRYFHKTTLTRLTQGLLWLLFFSAYDRTSE